MAPGPAVIDAVVDHRRERIMSETTTTAVPPTESERRLLRPADDRVVAGVCAGLARYFGLDPLVYRIAFAALVLLGGSGLLLYGAAWLVIPDERSGESLVEEAIRRHRDRPWLVVGAGLVGFGLLFGLAESDVWPDPGNLWVAALVLGLGVVWWQLRDRPRSAAPAASGPATGSTAAHGLAAPEAGAPSSSVAEPSTPRRGRVPIFLPTIGALLAAAGVLGILQVTDVVDVDWVLALAVGVVLIGLAVAVGAFFGATGALAVVGSILAAAMVLVAAVDIPLHGPIGDRTYHPVTAAELEPEYEVAIGTLRLDLRDLVLPAGATRVETTVGIGELTVLVPAGARVEVNSKVKAGEGNVLDDREEGWDVRQHVTIGDATATQTLVLDAEVGFGSLEVGTG
jgi:phage shock protein PspC (stress-responsive transcriptional regulator)